MSGVRRRGEEGCGGGTLRILLPGLPEAEVGAVVGWGVPGQRVRPS